MKTLACAAALILTAGAFSTLIAAPVGGQVDLTYAAEKAVPAVVHIKYVQNSKVKTVEVEDPFGGFFSDPFGFFGNPNSGEMELRLEHLTGRFVVFL